MPTQAMKWKILTQSDRQFHSEVAGFIAYAV